MMDASESTQQPPAELEGPAGFRAGAVAAGVRKPGRLDLGTIICELPATAAAVTTRNVFCGAPVTVTRERLAASPFVRGLIVNSGISNVCTGEEGNADARRMARLAELALSAAEDSFLVASTGVIGEPLPVDRIARAVPELMASASAHGWGAFARAIMTTDLVPKIARRELPAAAGRPASSILGICKGSGMIEPNMATMLAFITTDYPLTPESAQRLIREASDRSFNCVTVDGDTSTSDMAILLSSGMAFGRAQADASSDEQFAAALDEVCIELAKAIARDGEGARHLVTIEIEGAAADADARRIAKTIANSPLVKTAIFGRDPNWGRIAAAAGRAGIDFDPTRVSLEVQGRRIFEHGRPRPFDRAELINLLGEHDVLIRLSVGEGPGQARVWTCDFSFDYVKINAEYTT